MPNEKEILSPEGDKIPSSSQPGAGDGTTTPNQSQVSKVEELQKEIEGLKKSYSESSTEGKRLAAELKEALAEKEELNTYIDALEEKETGSAEAEEAKKAKEAEEAEEAERAEEAKAKQVEKPIRPSMSREEIKHEVRLTLKEEKEIERQANAELTEASKDFPALEKKSFRNRVYDKIKLNPTLKIKDACQNVVDEIEEERAENEGGEPFVESGTGAKGSQPKTGEENEIVDHLLENKKSGSFPGF